MAAITIWLQSMNLRSCLKKIPALTGGFRLAKRILGTTHGFRCRHALRSQILDRAVLLPDKSSLFVGYYDHSPFKEDAESVILVHATNHAAWRKPSPVVPVLVLLLNWRTGEVVKEIGHSYAWNWQQGARALWLDKENVIFNVYDAKTNSYRARIINVSGREQALLPTPVQEIDRFGRVYGISYEALNQIRPDYGYRCHRLKNSNLSHCSLDLYELSTGNFCTLVQVSELEEDAIKRHNLSVTKAKINHVMAAPDGQHIIFLFRYYINWCRITDLYLLDVQTGSWRCLVPNSGVSHACWKNDTTVLATMNGLSGFGYYEVNIFSGNAALVWSHSDGHPSSFNSDHFITDSYPDQYALRHLMVVSYTNPTQNEILGTYPEPLFFQGETRCDLHPSLSPSGKYIQVDCAVGHRRTVAVVPNPFFSCCRS